jgi:hypothetical protein
MMRPLAITLGSALCVATIAGAADSTPNPNSCPLHAAHTAGAHASHAAMLERGAAAMGFDQLRTSHHFRLSPSGGSIEVHTHATEDEALRGQVVDHLRGIAASFAAGDFATPLAVHGELPDGVTDLRRLGGAVRYEFEEGDLGARVWISSADPQGVAAIHRFLRYQIREHRTGDPLTVAR